MVIILSETRDGQGRIGATLSDVTMPVASHLFSLT
jgi:hypothetical protein